MNDITILDGGMGQELMARSDSEPTTLWSTQMLIDEPELVTDVHRAFIDAGADVITLASYTLTPSRLEAEGIGDQLGVLIDQAIDCAHQAVMMSDRQPVIAAGLGPLVASYQADLVPDLERSLGEYQAIIEHLTGRVDLVIAETVTTLIEVQAATQVAVEAGFTTWIALSVSEQEPERLRGGASLIDAAQLATELGASAVLVNCSTPEATSQAVAALAGFDLPIGAYANGFVDAQADLAAGDTVDGMRVRDDLDPDDYADFAAEWIADGATIVGGCCEVGPAHISELKQRFG